MIKKRGFNKLREQVDYAGKSNYCCVLKVFDLIMKFAFLCFTAILFGICNETMAKTIVNRTAQNTEIVTDEHLATTIKSGMFAETVQNFDTVNGNVANTSSKDFTDNENLLNVTLSEYDNSTDETDNEVDEIHSSFNLAIIPAVAVFVFIVISCIKCCKWFRQYTRGDNKDENYYAVIVTDEDKDYGEVDILSESASTAYYDTVSSYTSFLKRSGNESTLNSIRTLRLDGSKYDQNVTSLPNNGSMSRVPRSDVTKKSAADTDSKLINSCSTKKKDAAYGTSDIRTSSTSSADTISEQLTDSPIIRRNNRFRVSFVTEKPTAKPLTFENKVTNSNTKLDKAIRSSLKKTPTKEIRVQDVTPQSYSTNKAIERIKMVDVGTQTNKSFRYSLRKSKGHVSDSDIDDRLLAKLNFKKDESVNLHQSVVKRNTDKQAHTVLHARHSSLSQEEQHCEPLFSTIISEISKYPLDTNVQVINNQKAAKELDEEFEDDVFVKEDEKSSPPYSDPKKPSFIKELPQTNSKVNSESTESINENRSVNSVYICANCNPKTDEKRIEPFCDKSPSSVAKIEKVVPKYCKNCQILRKGKPRDSDDTVSTDLADVHLEEQCKFTLGDPPECDERRASSLSLESSGYAELSSTESSTSTQ